MSNNVDLITRGLSASSLGIKVISTNSSDSSSLIVDIVEVPGRRGQLVFDTGVYERFNLEVEVVATSTNLLQTSSQLRNWLCSDKKDLPIHITDNRDVYWLGYLDNKLKIHQVMNTFGTCRLVFNCQGMKRLVSGDSPITLTTKGSTINNTGTLESEPLIEVVGNGNITLQIDGSIIKLNGVNNRIFIDSENMECYTINTNGEIISNNSKMVGEFPKLDVGPNIIDWSGNVSKVIITPKWVTI